MSSRRSTRPTSAPPPPPSPAAPPSLPDSRQLGVLRAAVETGSLSAAARRLHVSQPAVTASIQKLEAQLGVALFERRARGVIATDAGRRLAVYAERVDALLDEAVAGIRERRAGLSSLVLGASTTIASGLAPGLIARFRAMEGPVSVRLEVGNTEEILEKVRDRTVALGLVEGPRRAPRVHLERFVDDTLLPVVSAELASAGPVELSTAVLWREVGSGTRKIMERELRRLGRKKEPHDLELGSTEAIRRAVELSLGLAFLSRWSIADSLASGRIQVVPLPSLRLERRFSWATATKELTGTAQRFYELAMRERSTLIPRG